MPESLAQDAYGYGSDINIINLPTARMNESGRIAVNIAQTPLHRHLELNTQIMPWLNVNIRQSKIIEDSSPGKGEYHPGVDIKLRLLEENEYRPDISIGANSLLGSRRMQSEYIVASKKWYGFDMHLGLGWGRLAGHNTIGNPVGTLQDHFDKDRDYLNTGRVYTKLDDLFTGDKIGIFGGVSYETPVQGLTTHMTWGGDDYKTFRQENNSSNVSKGSALSFGLSYQPPLMDNLTISAAWENQERLMFRTGYQFNAKKIPDLRLQKKSFSENIEHPENIQLIDDNMSQEKLTSILLNSDLGIHKVLFGKDAMRLWVNIDTKSQSSAQQISHIARYLAPYAVRHNKNIIFMTQKGAMSGVALELLAKDFLQEKDQYTTPQEIWHDSLMEPIVTATHNRNFIDRFKWQHFKQKWEFEIQNMVSLSEPEQALTYRQRARLNYDDHYGSTFWGLSYALNGAHNLSDLSAIREAAPYPTRGNERAFAERDTHIDRLYLARIRDFNQHIPTFNTNFQIGYFEEMYAGYGIQGMYRPFDKRWRRS